MKNFDYILIQTAYSGDDTPAYCINNSPENTLLFTFRYTPPYEQFTQLKELQLDERSENPFKNPFVLAIDITEWVGHSDEEYFEIICKYLADMKKRWTYIFLVSSRDKSEMKKLHIKLRTYMLGDFLIDGRWETEQGMAEFINTSFDYEPEAAAALAKILIRKEFDNYRSSSFVQSITNEILGSKRGKVTLQAFEKYVQDKNSLIFLLSDGKLIIRKDNSYDKI